MNERILDGWHACLCIGAEALRKFDREDHEEVAMNERILDGWHALILDGFHEAGVVDRIWILDHIHSGTLLCFFCCHALLTGSLLEACSAGCNNKSPHVDSLSLQLCFTSFFQCVDICCVSLGDIVEGRAIAILESIPLHSVLLALQRIETAWHGFDQLSR